MIHGYTELASVAILAFWARKEKKMPATIPDSHADLFGKKAFGSLATLNADGTPQVTPVWVDREGGFIMFNSARGRN